MGIYKSRAEDAVQFPDIAAGGVFRYNARHCAIFVQYQHLSGPQKSLTVEYIFSF